MLSRIAGEPSDEQFLKVAGLDGRARSRVVYDLLMLEQILKDIHVVEIFSQPKALATWIDLRHVTQLLVPGCSGEH